MNGDEAMRNLNPKSAPKWRWRLNWSERWLIRVFICLPIPPVHSHPWMRICTHLCIIETVFDSFPIHVDTVVVVLWIHNETAPFTPSRRYIRSIVFVQIFTKVAYGRSELENRSCIIHVWLCAFNYLWSQNKYIYSIAMICIVPILTGSIANIR